FSLISAFPDFHHLYQEMPEFPLFKANSGIFSSSYFTSLLWIDATPKRGVGGSNPLGDASEKPWKLTVSKAFVISIKIPPYGHQEKQ
ncbi:MAG: hypothetical protein IKG19_03260, partial [Lachnospiraceae bacterium]|nr:hypothetical protein [Lachnospiraceae bacterium]